MNISVVIPCYNEEKTIETVVDKILKIQNLEKEIIIVDDCSKDRSREIIEKMSQNYDCIKYFFHEKNLGKGSALQTGFKEARNEIILIQDADLEYDPQDFDKLLEPFRNTDADVVYGSRFLGGSYVRLHFEYLANKLLTFLTNMVTNLMSDMEPVIKFSKILVNNFTKRKIFV